VGQKGVRVQAVITELGGNEKVDIIQWSDDMKLFIMAALAPAKDMEVVLNEKKQAAEVAVPDDQLSLAIGRDGGNVRLAAKLTGWKIDIKGKGVPAGEAAAEKTEAAASEEPKEEAVTPKETKEETAPVTSEEAVAQAPEPVTPESAAEPQKEPETKPEEQTEVKDSTDTNTSS
jgi:N utilization substance protein A